MLIDDNDNQKRDEIFYNRQATYDTQSNISTYHYLFEAKQLKTNEEQENISKILKEVNKQIQLQVHFKSIFKFIQISAKKYHGDDVQFRQIYRMVSIYFVRQLLAFISFVAQNTSNKTRQIQLIQGKTTVMIKKQKNKYLITFQTSELTQNINYDNIVSVSSQTSFRASHIKKIHETNINIYLESMLDKKIKIDLLTSKNAHLFYIIQTFNKLGTGGFGEVYKAEGIKFIQNNLVSSDWAIKQFKKQVEQYEGEGFAIGQDRQYEMLNRIKQILKNTPNHKAGKYIIYLKQVITHKQKRFIVYEYCKHNSIRQFIKKGNKKLNNKHKFSIILQLASTLKLIHYDLINTDNIKFAQFALSNEKDNELRRDRQIIQSQIMKDRNYNLIKGIIHRDIKLNNILIKKINDHSITIKLIDWAFSKRTFTQVSICRISCGTANYQAPELDKKKVYSCKADVWSCGAVIYQLLAGQAYCEKGKSMKQDKLKIQQKLKKMQFLGFYSQEEKLFWKNILAHSLKANQQQRWTSKRLQIQLKSHPLFQPFNEINKKQIIDLQMKMAVFHVQISNAKILLQKSGSNSQRMLIKNIWNLTIAAFVEIVENKLSHIYAENEFDERIISELTENISVLNLQNINLKMKIGKFGKLINATKICFGKDSLVLTQTLEYFKQQIQKLKNNKQMNQISSFI